MRRSLLLLVIAAAVLVTAVISIVALLRRPALTNDRTLPAPSPDEKTYLSALMVADARMSAAQNFLGQEVTYLDAKLTNNGSRTVRSVEIQMEFHDTLAQVVLRDTYRPVNLHLPPLNPGEARAFRVAFDHMPLDWNQAPPTLTIKSVSF